MIGETTSGGPLNIATPKRRLKFVDGLRGIAALVVAVGHIIGMVGPDHPVIPIWEADAGTLLMWPWMFGGPAVWLFIMLSGFTLYWTEESRRMSTHGPTPLKVYIQRRLWRILPSYYMALAFGAVVVVGLGALLLDPSPSLQTYGPVTWSGVVSHLFMVHNLNPAWTYQIVPPLWSIAVEMQLYMLFPLVFLLRRKLSVYGTAVCIVAVVFALNKVADFPVFGLIEWFVLGTVLAHVLRRYRIPVGVSMPAALLALIIGFMRVPAVTGRMEQAVWLVAFAALIAWFFAIDGRRLNVLEARPILWLGARSYSLYVVHFPIALLCWAFVGRMDLSRPASIVVVVAFGLSASLLAASANFEWVERPSLGKSRLAGRGKEPIPPTAHAPSPIK